MPQNQKSKIEHQESRISPAFKQTKIGRLPVEWEVVTLKNVCTKLNVGFVGTCKKFYTDKKLGFPLISTSNLYQGEFRLENTNYVTKEFHEKNKKSQISGGDILIARHSSSGSAVILPKYIEEANSLNIVIVRVNNRRATSYFCAEAINSYQVRKQVNATMAGSSQQVVNTGDIAKLKIPLPPLPEQTRIATCLTTWDRAITTTRQLIEQLEQRKKGLMQQLLSGEVRLPGFSGEWEESNLGEYFNERGETGFDNLELLSIGQNGVYPQDQSNKKDTSNNDKSKYKRICPRDIGYNTMRMWQGRSAISTVEGIVSPAYTILKPKINTDPDFFIYLFHTHPLIHKFFQYSQGLVSDTWQCKFKDFVKVRAMLPPTIKEQTAIAAVLTAADREITLYREQLAALETQKKGLLQQLLTGRKRLPA